MANGPLPKDKPQVLHHCDNRACVRLSHFWVGTHKDNMADAARKSRMARGEKHGSKTRPDRIPHIQGSRHGMSKLKEEDIPVIRALLAKGVSQSEIARNFSVLPSAISRIKTGERWRHVA